jgi:hypothetical protein
MPPSPQKTSKQPSEGRMEPSSSLVFSHISVHSADVVLNILSRHRDPGPVATILTPDALRLRHLPIADCARYDNLRKAS